MPTQSQIEAVRNTWPAWDDLTIQRHLQQQASLARNAEELRKKRLIDCLSVHYEVLQS